MGERRFIKHEPFGLGYLNTIPSGTVIMASCLSCGAQRELDREALERQTRTGDLEPIRKRLRCDKCGEQNAKISLGYYGT